jgi:hypothetical protein
VTTAQFSGVLPLTYRPLRCLFKQTATDCSRSNPHPDNCVWSPRSRQPRAHEPAPLWANTLCLVMSLLSHYYCLARPSLHHHMACVIIRQS